ncbi:MAG: capsular biosynthesis protein, partial [Verrucomicrobia bacterium]|nr:capsular biosynthesis protein [Verrucomicrobiota bacterium]
MDTPKTFDAPESQLHFLDYWRIIRIRKTVILAVFLLVSITTTLITFILPQQYESTVRIRVEKDAPDVSTLSFSLQSQGYDPYWIQTEFEVLKSKSILFPVITNLDLNHLFAQRNKAESFETDLTYTLLKKQVDVEQYRNTSVIEIRVEDQSQQHAMDIANEIAHVYKSNRLKSLTDTYFRGIQNLEKELTRVDDQTRELQTKVENLKVELKIPDAEDRAFYSSSVPEPEILRHLENLRIESQAEYEHHRTMYSSLTNLTRGEFKTSILTASPDPYLQNLLERQAETEQKLADLI